MMKTISLLIFLIVLSACSNFSGNSQAEKALKNFIDARFDTNMTKEQMLKYVDGEMASEIHDMGIDEFDFFTKLKGFKKTDFKILTSNCEKKKCVIVYNLQYDEYKMNTKQFSTEVKKAAEVVRDTEGFWKIVKVDNVKTYLKNHEEIEITND